MQFRYIGVTKLSVGVKTCVCERERERESPKPCNGEGWGKSATKLMDSI